MLVLVKDRRTGNERTVTQKAYAAMGPKVYEKLRFVNDDGSEIGGPQNPNSQTTQGNQVSRSVKAAGPVVVKSQLVTPQNANGSQDQAPAKSETESTTQPEKKTRKSRKQSIPSSSDAEGK